VQHRLQRRFWSHLRMASSLTHFTCFLRIEANEKGCSPEPLESAVHQGEPKVCDTEVQCMVSEVLHEAGLGV
ncbi:hypothetical protein NDU88_006995, partial [Pleurodeles waltl]